MKPLIAPTILSCYTPKYYTLEEPQSNFCWKCWAITGFYCFSSTTENVPNLSPAAECVKFMGLYTNITEKSILLFEIGKWNEQSIKRTWKLKFMNILYFLTIYLIYHSIILYSKRNGFCLSFNNSFVYSYFGNRSFQT